MAQAKAQVLPNVVNNAKSRGKSAAKRVFDDRRGHIIAIGLIPFYGWVKSQMLVADAKRDAINDARNAAKASVIDDFNSEAVKVKDEPCEWFALRCFVLPCLAFFALYYFSLRVALFK